MVSEKIQQQADVQAAPKKIRKRLGDRHDGRRVRTLPPMQYVTSFVMKERNDASNFFQGRVQLDSIIPYMRKKTREEKLIGFGFMHVLTAAYVRMLSQYPGLNRYIAGQRIYKRDHIVMSMMVKKGTSLNDQGTAIKPVFAPTDTIYDVYQKMQREIDLAREAGDSTNMDTVARAITKLPTLLLRGFIDLMRLMDYFGIMPRVIDRASPFHASLFISNLGSLGIPPIYHHLYNFGNVPVFITFGAVYKENELNADGQVVTHRYIDYTAVTDERITDGQYYASGLKQLNRLLQHPEELDHAPETVAEDVD